LGLGKSVGKEGERWKLYFGDRRRASSQKQEPQKVKMRLEDHF